MTGIQMVDIMLLGKTQELRMEPNLFFYFTLIFKDVVIRCEYKL